MKITGTDKVNARLKRLAGIRREVSAALYEAADTHAAEASHLITEGAVSGKNHVPSLPGKPPNEDTGTLRTSIHVEPAGDLKVKSVANAPYAAALEFGTSHIVERPFMRPAAKKIRTEVLKKMQAIVRKANRKGA